jgi:hypothetical protein
MGEEEAEWVFKMILQWHRDLFLGPARMSCGTSDSWFSGESERYRTEGRLFAQAFPTLAERLALEVLNDPEAHSLDRSFAWFILGVLAPRTSATLEDFLTEQVNSISEEQSWERDVALSNLINRRFDERTLALCRAKARAGNQTAIDALTTVVDPEAIRLFQETNAGEMLERITILQSKDWREKLWQLLMGRVSGKHHLHIHWALEAAERQAMPELRSALEVRIQKLRKRGTPPQRRWGYDDPDHEFLLVAWVRLGGALEAREEEYLTHFGFFGNYEQRLQELLTTRQGRR